MIDVVIGKVEDSLPNFPDKHFDACFCDPPYGLSFMGKEWDRGVPPASVWAEVLRVLVPGAPLLAFGGTRTYHRLTCAIEDAGFEIRDCLMWLYGSGFPKSKTCLKPAWEPVVLGRAPGACPDLAIDECRIATDDKLGGGAISSHAEGWDRPWKADEYAVAAIRARSDAAVDRAERLGRWPANVILDEEAGAALDEQSGISKPKAGRTGKRGGTAVFGQKGIGSPEQEGTWPADAGGGASRFFYCAKASKAERGEGNAHPCVKPLALTEYLAKILLPPPRDTPRRILVPFSGSGSEMIGCVRAGWDEVIGIEMDEAHVEVAACRLAA